MFAHLSNTLCLEFVLCVDFFPFIGSSLSHITCSVNILFDPHEIPKIPKMFMIPVPNKIIYYVLTRLYSSKMYYLQFNINNETIYRYIFLRLCLLLV